MLLPSFFEPSELTTCDHSLVLRCGWTRIPIFIFPKDEMDAKEIVLNSTEAFQWRRSRFVELSAWMTSFETATKILLFVITLSSMSCSFYIIIMIIIHKKKHLGKQLVSWSLYRWIFLNGYHSWWMGNTYLIHGHVKSC